MKARLYVLCTSLLATYASCVVFRSAPNYQKSCSSACYPGLSVRDACMVYQTRGYMLLGYTYTSASGGPSSCVTGTGTVSSNMTCLCAEHADDWRTIPIDTGNGTDCGSACSSDGDSRNRNWSYSNSVTSTSSNVTQLGATFCNVSAWTWGIHYDAEVRKLTSSGPNVLDGDVLQYWNGVNGNACNIGIVNIQDQAPSVTSSSFGNSTQCLCARFQPLQEALFSQADDLENKPYTPGPLPDLSARLHGPTPGPAPSSGIEQGGAPSAGPAVAPAVAEGPAPQKGPSSTAAAVGGAVGGAAGALLIASLSIWLIRWRHRGGTIKGQMGAHGRAGPGIPSPWAPHKAKPFWRSLLPSVASGSSRSAPGINTGSGEMGSLNVTSVILDAPESVPLSSLTAQTYTSLGLMNIEELNLTTAGEANAASGTELTEQRAERVPAAGLHSQGGPHPEMNSNTSNTVALVDSELPPQLRNTWQIKLDQLQLYRDSKRRPVTLGKGAYGTVYLGMLDGVRKVAVKIVNSPTQRHQQSFAREIATLRACYDSNIVAFLGASLQEGKTFLVMEYMANGSLWDCLQRDSQNELRWYNRGRKVALDVAAGISFLHRNDIVHLDLKSPNVLLDEHNKACIADIGLGKMLVGQEALASAATFFWAAPEQLQGLPVSKASDIFSLGVVIWEIVTGEQPLQRKYREVKVPDECPAEIAALLAACFSRIQAERPIINEVFQTLRDAPR